MTSLDMALGALALAIAGMLAALFVPATIGRALGYLSVVLSGIAALVAGVVTLVAGGAQSAGNADLHVVVRLDATSAFFIGIIGAVAITVGLFGLGGRSRDERRTGRTAASTACAILLASLLACLADDVFLFLFAWELLALAFYWAIAFAGTDENAELAGYFTLTLTHVAGAALFVALLILARENTSVSGALGAAQTLPPFARGAIFVLLLIGFGAKIGLLPLQGWMPYGYRATPSVVAALMAGGALNVGFYGIVRFVFGLTGATPLWWGLLLASLGALGAILGIAWAVAQRDARTLAAYSSIENSGVIVAGLGIALVGRSIDLPLLVGVGLASAFFQIAAHAFAKCTLFLACAALDSRAGSTSFDQLGGIARRMPYTAAAAITAAFSLAAIPPLGGFASEWLTLESFMQAFRSSNAAVDVTFALCAAAIGVAAGLAIVAFVKFAGTGFLGAPRSPEASEAREGNILWPLASSLSAIAVLALGLLAPQYLALIAAPIDQLSGTPAVASMLAAPPVVQPAFHGFSSVSPLGLGILMLCFALLFAIIARLFARPRLRSAEVWTSGEAYRSWTQYGGTGFANPTRVIFDVGIRTVRSIEETEDAGVRYESRTRQFFDVAFYNWIVASALRISDAVRRTQSGVIGTYLTYILVFTILLLVMYPSLRHW
ncbi:MAG: proton-conducting transporter membrane subunit [Vulcanimicrobiaceae bacterium]|jgi:formate hydrogenlyase subunit 3/multisubunit Na+/H+ antiporter MnhD subunit